MIARLTQQGKGPLFLFVHFMDAHSPYNPVSVPEGGPSKERYLRAVSVVDTQLGRIQKAISDLGLDDRTTMVVTADHGEAFGEHGTHFHGVSVYEELIHVPLLMKTKGAAPRRVDAPVSLIDLGPTVLDFMGLPTPGRFMGQSLAPFLRGERPKLTRPIVSEQRLKQAMVFPDGIQAIRDIRKGTTEIYD